MTKCKSLAVAAIAASTMLSLESTMAFVPTSQQKSIVSTPSSQQQRILTQYYMSSTEEAKSSSEESAFVPLDDADVPKDDEVFDKVESFGRGSAKKKRGRRKGGSSTEVKSKETVTLAPEEVYYEGPPAITETIAPTVSILTVVGIIPAAAAWARQAWVRYKITSRRIRVNSGVGGKEMAEIVYPDIVEIRTAKRLFGDGDLVAFLRDGAKFEMRNIPNFDETMEFILDQVSPEVKQQYLEGGDVTNP